MQRTLPLQDKGFKTISDEQPIVPFAPMENQHAPGLLASTGSLAEDLTDEEVSISTDQNIFSFAQEMAKGKVIIDIYIFKIAWSFESYTSFTVTGTSGGIAELQLFS